MSSPPKLARRAFERRGDRPLVGDVAGETEEVVPRVQGCDRRVEIEPDDRRAAREERRYRTPCRCPRRRRSPAPPRPRTAAPGPPSSASPARDPSTRRRRCPAPAAPRSRPAPRPARMTSIVCSYRSSTIRDILGGAAEARQSERGDRAPSAVPGRAWSCAPSRSARAARSTRDKRRDSRRHRAPSIGTRLVRITWSGVAGPCCEMRGDLGVPRERERLPGRAGTHDEREPGGVRDPRDGARPAPRRRSRARPAPVRSPRPTHDAGRDRPRPGRRGRSCARTTRGRSRRRRRCRASSGRRRSSPASRHERTRAPRPGRDRTPASRRG